ncbi:MAG: Gfo/Idh/MocA family oxidoreductase [Ruminococcaceae bacterium]|jgi:predicted dehydrogenase|nr:Gfo/Idh/MocA family oxidoreductase [Oscillospiraceae bacterium]
MSVIKIAILGQGRSGRDIHAVNLMYLTDLYQIVAIVDPLPDRRERAAREFKCDTYAHYTEILQRTDIDLVVNATPSYLHGPITIDLLNHGFNVLVEKPMSRSVAEVDAMIAAAEKNKRLLTIFQQSRFAPYFVKVREVIDSGVLGRIVQIGISFSGYARRWDWQCLQSFNGGSLLNTGPHPLDQALQLFGDDVEPQVTCFMDRVNTFGDAEDYVKLLLHGPGKPVIDLEISSANAYPSFTYLVQGTRGSLKGNMQRIDWKYFILEEAPPQQLIRTPLKKPDGTPAYCSEQLTWHEDAWDLPQEQKDLFETIATTYYKRLYKALTENSPLDITPQQVRRQIAVIEACHRQNPLSRLD